MKKLLRKWLGLETRNLAVADMYQAQMPTPIWTNWTVERAVREGYKVSGWVYRAVFLIMKAAASVPWCVYNEDGEKIVEHHLSKLFQRPNPHVSRQDLFELLVSWLELTGNAYLKKVKVGTETTELIPVSPDRLRPVPSQNLDEWVKGYALDLNTTATFEPEEIIHFLFTNPANPLIGISPLEAAAKTVDADVDQVSFNKAAMQNRGVIDGIFTFEREFESQDDADTIGDRLNERYGGPKNARRIGVVGGKATYHRTAMTPVEGDFTETRKANREEIFIIFGVPPQYAGVQETSTYNNYSVSGLVFWFSTIIPLLDDLKDTLNFSFNDELMPGDKLGYDLSQVAVIREAMFDKAKTAETLYKMGVPFDQINKIFEFGAEEFEGWDVSRPATTATSSQGTSREPEDSEGERSGFTLMETRSNPEFEKKLDEQVGEYLSVYVDLLEKQRIAVFEDIEKNKGANIQTIIEGTSDDWIKALMAHYTTVGTDFGKTTVVEQRQIEDPLELAIAEYLEQEAVVLEEKSNIHKTTVARVIEQVDEGLASGLTVNQIQQAIQDVGVFSPERSLMLSRTITGTAASLGQWQAGTIAGATHKRWVTAGFEVRDEHAEREGEEVPINETFSPKFGMAIGPRYPLDNRLVPADRVNCRCSLSFSRRE